MVLRLRLRNVKTGIIYLLLISTMIGYLGYYLAAKDNRQIIQFLYSNYTIRGLPFWADIVRYAKDVMICLLALMVITDKKTLKNANLLILIGMFLLFSAANAIMQGAGSMDLVTGVRTYLYFIVFLLMSQNLQKVRLNAHFIYILLMAGLVLNILVGLDQASIGTRNNLSLVGSGAYRYPCLYGGVNGVGSLAIITALFAFCLEKRLQLSRLVMALTFLLSISMTVIAGSRSAMINVGFLFVVWAVEKIRANSASKLFILFFALLIAVPVLISYSTSLADRGSILQVQLESGRIAILGQIFSGFNAWQLLFGHGLGVGGNANTILRQVSNLTGSKVLDGTFNLVLYQYGLMGFVTILYLLLAMYRKIKEVGSLTLTVAITGTLLLQCLTGNITELFTFIIVFFMCYWSLNNPEIFQFGSKRNLGEAGREHADGDRYLLKTYR